MNDGWLRDTAGVVSTTSGTLGSTPPIRTMVGHTRGTKRRAPDAAGESPADPEALRDVGGNSRRTRRPADAPQADDEHDTRPTKFTRATEPDAAEVTGTRSPAASAEAPPDPKEGDAREDAPDAPSDHKPADKDNVDNVVDAEKDNDVNAKSAEGEKSGKGSSTPPPSVPTKPDVSSKALSMFGAGKKGGRDEIDEEEEESPPRAPPTNKAVSKLGESATPAMSPLAKVGSTAFLLVTPELHADILVMSSAFYSIQSMGSKLSTNDNSSAFAPAGSSVLTSTFGSSTANKASFGSFSGSVFGAGTGFGSSSGTGGGFGSFATSSTGTDFASLLVKKSAAKGKGKDADEKEGGAEEDSAGEGSEGGEVAEAEFQPDDYKPKIHLEQKEVVTGEEDEDTICHVRGKLFDFDEGKGEKGDWKERGVGLLRLNKKIGDDTARLGGFSLTVALALKLTQKAQVMRMDGVLRVILNVALFKNMTCVLVQEKFIRFIASETPGKLTTFLLKVIFIHLHFIDYKLNSS